MPNFPNYFMFLGTSALPLAIPMGLIRHKLCGAQGQTPQVDMRQSSSMRKCRCVCVTGVKPSGFVVGPFLRVYVSDPAHDAVN